MPSTVLRSATAVSGALAVMLLVACSGDADSSADSSPAQTQAAQPSGSGGDDFCARAADLDERVETALSDVEGDDPSVADAFRRLADEMRDVDAPDAIASDWDSMAAGLDRMSEAFADLDVANSD